MKRLLCVLAALILLCGCAPQQKAEETAAPSPMVGMEFSENTLLRREDVETLLICAVSYDDENHSMLTSLNVLVRDESGGISLLTIPKDTRVWVEQYDADGNYSYCNYGAIGSVYYAAESAGLAEKKTVEAVSSLLGGVRIDHYAFLNVVQLRELTEITGGVYLTVEDAIVEYGIIPGFQDIVPNIVGYSSYSYLNDIGGVDYPGTDPYKLQRHQQLIQAIMQALAGQMSTQSAPEREEISRQVVDTLRTNLDAQTLANWLSDESPVFSEVKILEGRQDERRNVSYWIHDWSSAREWVLRHFYLTDEE